MGYSPTWQLASSMSRRNNGKAMARILMSLALGPVNCCKHVVLQLLKFLVHHCQASFFYSMGMALIWKKRNNFQLNMYIAQKNIYLIDFIQGLRVDNIFCSLIRTKNPQIPVRSNSATAHIQLPMGKARFFQV